MTSENTENFDHLSDEDMKDLIRQNDYLNSLTREELIAKIKADSISVKNSPIANMEIHPLSEIAKAAASPGEAFVKDVQGTLWWEWVIIGTVVLVLLIVFPIAFSL